MGNVKLIAFDLDDTLFNTKKEITPETFNALEKAASMGIEIVPATGRFWYAVPESIKSMKFVRYIITLNGGEIFDVKESKSLARFELSVGLTIALAKTFEEYFPEAIYDCVMDGKGFMNQKCFDKIPEHMINEWQTKLVRDFRTPVDDLPKLIAEKNTGGQKMQIYTLDKELRENLLKALPIVFPKALFTSAIKNNIEINALSANKGNGLKFIAQHLNIPLENTLAFGDGLNDIDLIKTAGTGIAMENACEELKNVADYITLSCNDNGVAEGIKKFCFTR